MQPNTTAAHAALLAQVSRYPGRYPVAAALPESAPQPLLQPVPERKPDALTTGQREHLLKVRAALITQCGPLDELLSSTAWIAVNGLSSADWRSVGSAAGRLVGLIELVLERDRAAREIGLRRTSLKKRHVLAEAAQ
ncbi:hypothetical protein [Silvimonas sp.]|uniref:hypothetical protein n=1 Tax=Silvimonas sp. TaxID=2650811 RepID=UPI002846BC4C|nr:hypothetical protein [Silvimonas sp.]MDR3428995.1 hypothetical protein [Silvimonas sp.]